MKVKDLIENLKNVDPERVVVLSTDGEGNYYNTLFSIETDMYYKVKEHWVFDEEERVKENYSTEDCIKAVVLWP